MKLEHTVIETILTKYSHHEDLYRELMHFFHQSNLSPTSIEALANYIYNQKCVVQEIIHPNGQIERLNPLHPNFALDDLDTSRFLSTVQAWYDQKNQQLQRIHNNWENWMEGVFSCVERDEKLKETTYWTIRDSAEKNRSIWSLQTEQDGGKTQNQTFAVAHKTLSNSKEKTQDRTQDLLQKTYQTYTQRVNRILFLLQHLHSLGLRSIQEYKTWCEKHRLSTDLLKTVQQRRQELKLRQDSKVSDSHWFKECVTRIHNNEATDEDLRTDYLRKIAYAFSGGLAGGARKAYLDLLLHAEQNANLFVLQPAIPALGPERGNTFVEGLSELARYYHHWVRPISTWQPNTHDPRRQFNALAQHLFSPYPMPAFMDAAWFRGRSGLAQQHQGWFLHLASGQNIRTANLPVTFTKRMAHEFPQAPEHYTIEEALRWTQIIGQGGTQELVDAIHATFLGDSFKNEAFWSTVIQFLVANPMLDPDYVNPILDYIYNQKYVSREVINPGGEIVVLDPPEPKFAMKARSIDKLLDQVESWHRMLTREQRAPKIQWDKTPINNYLYTEKDTQTGSALHWSIRELLSQTELKAEGRALHHCVATYTKNCQKGTTSVWSLSVTNSQNQTLHLATIALNPQTRNITQLRGKYNVLPKMTPKGEVLRAGLEEWYVNYLLRGRDILRQWVRQEHLGSRGGDLKAWVG